MKFLIDAQLPARLSRLLIVHTGNIANNDLLDLFAEHLNDIECALQQANLVELRNDRLIVHADRTAG